MKGEERYKGIIEEGRVSIMLLFLLLGDTGMRHESGCVNKYLVNTLVVEAM